MRFSILSVLCLWGLLFAVSACEDQMFADVQPVDEIGPAIHQDFEGFREAFVLQPIDVAFAFTQVVPKYPLSKSAGDTAQTDNPWDSFEPVFPEGSKSAGDSAQHDDPWDTIIEKFGPESVHTGKSGSDSTQHNNPWDTINDKFGPDTVHTGKSGNDSTRYDDPWDRIFDNFSVGTRHTGKSGSDSTQHNDPWDTISQSFGEDSVHSGKKKKRPHPLAFVLGYVSHELDLFVTADALAATLPALLGGHPEKVDVWNGGPETVLGGLRRPDLFLAPSLKYPVGRFVVVQVGTAGVIIESPEGVPALLASYDLGSVAVGDIVELSSAGGKIRWRIQSV